jgi:AMP-activated protein kinase-like protein
MIKRTTKLKSNPTRATLTKAAPMKVEPAKVEAAKPEPMSKPSPVKALRKAHLELVKPEAKSVFVAGSFNEWNPVPLTRSNDGKWVGDLTGISGRHEYLFVVDGQWLPDPNARESVQNPFGGKNSVLIVSE